jgi:uncharacterized protein
MKVQLENTGAQNVIRAYVPGRVTINQEVYTASLIVTPERIVSDWPPGQFSELTAAHFDAIAALSPEVVLIGTGQQLQFPSPALTRALTNAQIGFEAMDTGAACRTYNVLMSEGRRVAAALLVSAKVG